MDAAGSEYILAQMAKSQLSLSYRAQGYTYLATLANFARVRRRGFLPPEVDPLEDVAAPDAAQRRLVERKDMPSLAQVNALGDNMGAVATSKWLRGVKHPSPERLARVELARFRWSMLPRIIFGGGLRPNEALALRTGDFQLTDRDEGLGIKIERQAARGISTGTRPPKHGSERTTFMPDELWDDVMRLVTMLEAEFGPNVLVWPRMRDHTKMLDDSTLFSAYYDPAAELTDGFTYEMVAQWTVKVEHDPDNHARAVLITVPLLDRDGKQRQRKNWNFNWRHLRHLYSTTALAPRATDGWGQDIADVAVWMGYRSAETTWEYYIGQRPEGGARMAAGTKASSKSAPPRPQVDRTARHGPRTHLRVVS